MPHWPSSLLQRRRDPSVAIPAVLACQDDDGLRPRTFVAAQNRSIALWPSPLPQEPADRLLGESIFLSCTLYRTTSRSGRSNLGVDNVICICKSYHALRSRTFSRGGASWSCGYNRVETFALIFHRGSGAISRSGGGWTVSHHATQGQVRALECSRDWVEWWGSTLNKA